MSGDEDDDFKIWVSGAPTGPNQLGSEGVTLKKGGQVCKTVSLSRYGNTETGEVKKTELRFRTSPRDPWGGYDFKAGQTWACENLEIDKLRAFLNEKLEPGKYRLVSTDSPEAELVEMLRSGATSAERLLRLLTDDGGTDALAAALGQSAAGMSAAETAVVVRRRELVARLKDLVEDPDTTETLVQAQMGNEWWLFGGRYVGVAKRNIVSMDQHDIPLLGADGTLHIVELKGPNIPRLVHQHRNHPIVGAAVHEAVSQAMNYIRALDEDGAGLKTKYENDFGESYDMRRVFATVVVGHPSHVTTGFSEEQVNQTIRSYNSHLSRVQVITYKELLDDADRALAFEAQAQQEHELVATAPDPWDEPLEDPYAEPDYGYDEEPF